MFKGLSRGVLSVIGLLVAIVVVSVVATYLFGGMAQLTAPFRGQTEEAERTEADGGFRIATRDRFHDLCSSAMDAQAQIEGLEAELETADGDRAETINASITGARAAVADSVNAYNELAAKGHTKDLRAEGLPEKLDKNQEITCSVQ